MTILPADQPSEEVAPVDFELIRRMYAKDCTTDEFRVFCAMADRLGLNPMLHQIWAIKYPGGGPATIIVGRDGLMDVAHRDGNFDGIESGTEGSLKEGNLIGWCRVYRKDMSHPFSVIVRYDEYVNTKKDGEITKFWKKMPHTMIQKVAQAQALRQAFRVTGVYCEDEMPSAPEPRVIPDTSAKKGAADPNGNPNKCTKCGCDIDPEHIEKILEHTDGVPMCNRCFSDWHHKQCAEADAKLAAVQEAKAAKKAEPKPEPRPEPTPEPVTVVLCSQCGNEAEPEYVDFSKKKAGKVMCKACFEAWAQAKPKPAPQPAPETPKNFCRSCDKEIPLGTTHCLDCVSATHGKPPERAPKPAPAPTTNDDVMRCVYCHEPLSEKEQMMYEKKLFNKPTCLTCADNNQRSEL